MIASFKIDAAIGVRAIIRSLSLRERRENSAQGFSQDSRTIRIMSRKSNHGRACSTSKSDPRESHYRAFMLEEDLSPEMSSLFRYPRKFLGHTDRFARVHLDVTAVDHRPGYRLWRQVG